MARLRGAIGRWFQRSQRARLLPPDLPSQPAQGHAVADAAFILAGVEELLVRERLFREDFEHRVSAELRSAIDAQLATHRLRAPVAFGDRTKVMIHTVDGHRLILDMAEPFMAYHLIEHGEWERPVRSVLRRLLPKGGTFVDVGANIGAHSLLAASLVGPDGHVIALEPHPGTCAILRENAEINGLHERIRVVQQAAAQVPGTIVAFEYFPQHPAMSGFKVAAERIDDFHGTPQSIEVRTTSLDSLLAAQVPQSDLIKIDVEGFELDVLKGASRLLSSVSETCFLVEFDVQLVTSVLGAEAVAEFWQLIEQAGLHAFLVDEIVSPAPLTWADFQATRGDLLLARPASRAYRLIAELPTSPI